MVAQQGERVGAQPGLILLVRQQAAVELHCPGVGAGAGGCGRGHAGRAYRGCGDAQREAQAQACAAQPAVLHCPLHSGPASSPAPCTISARVWP